MAPEQPPLQGSAKAETLAPTCTAILAPHPNFTGMQPRSYLKSPSGRKGHPRTAHAHSMARPGPSKAARTPSPAAFTSRPRNRSSYRRTIRSRESRSPRRFRSPSSAARRLDRDVGEESGGKDPVGVGTATSSGQELLDLVDHGIAAADDDQGVPAGKFREPGPLLITTELSI